MRQGEGVSQKQREVMTETEREMYEIEMYRCVREIRTGVLHREKPGVLRDGCRITNQSIAASQEGGETVRQD